MTPPKGVLLTPDLEKLTDILDSGEYILTSYGLAPNPSGFCFQFIGDRENKQTTRRLDKLLDGLCDSETQYLREHYL